MSQIDIKCDPGSICFGFDRQTDEQSLAMFVRCFAKDELLENLLPRLSDAEISDMVDFLTGAMNRHFSEGEYHKFFLGRKG